MLFDNKFFFFKFRNIKEDCTGMISTPFLNISVTVR